MIDAIRNWAPIVNVIFGIVFGYIFYLFLAAFRAGKWVTRQEDVADALKQFRGEIATHLEALTTTQSGYKQAFEAAIRDEHQAWRDQLDELRDEFGAMRVKQSAQERSVELHEKRLDVVELRINHDRRNGPR